MQPIPSTSSDPGDGSRGGRRTRRCVAGLGVLRGRGAGRAVGRGAGRGRGQGRGVGVGQLVLPPGWSKSASVNPPAVHQFAELSGPTTILPSTSTPLKFFEQIFGADFFEVFAVATNINATVVSPPRPDQAAGQYATSDATWKPTSAEEMRAFVAINMAMGINQSPEYKDAWSVDPIVRNGFISSVMSRTRYEKLSQYMHCSVAANEVAGDKLAKVRPIITLCEQSFARCFVPSQNISVDEAMIRFDGRLSWKQYMPKKPVKWGIKLWCLCDANTGYCIAFNVYTGRNEDQAVNLDLGYKVVMRLMRNYLHRYHHVYADNFFTSVHLADALLQADTYLCGTTRATRKEFPKALAKAVLRQGESVKWSSDNSVMLCKWRDKRDIFLISTNDAGGDNEVEVRRKRQLVTLATPTCVQKYNKYMGGVDRMDQMRSYYGVGRTGRRWWKYVFWGVMNIGVINAQILWTLCNRPLPANERLFSLKSFKMKLIHNLADDFISARQQQEGPSTQTVADYVVREDVANGHHLVHFSGRKRVCRICSAQKKKTLSGRQVETSFGCIICNVHLCKTGTCFNQYHS